MLLFYTAFYSKQQAAFGISISISVGQWTGFLCSTLGPDASLLRDQGVYWLLQEVSELFRSIFSAKEQIAFKKNARVGVIPTATDAEIDSYLRGASVTDTCPGGGTYTIGALVDGNAQVIIPTCDESAADGGGGVTFEQQGLHIHRRSYEQNATGVYSQNADYTFAS